MELHLITYGADQFDSNLFQPIQNDFIKPIGGLWASPVNSEYGWIDWCKTEIFNYKSGKGLGINFSFFYSGNIFVIDSLADVVEMPWQKNIIMTPDFEKMVINGIDAIFLTEKGQIETRLSYPYSLYGWDCECVLIMNPKGIITLI